MGNINNEENGLFNIFPFDTNIAQIIFTKLFKIYKYDFQENREKTYTIYPVILQKIYQNYFEKTNNFGLVCKLFNNISKQTLFTLNICNIKFQIPCNLYVKISCAEETVQMYYTEKNIDTILISACKTGFYDLVNVLINTGKANINHVYSATITPIYEATRSNKIQILKELFKHKDLNINIKVGVNPPFVEACQQGYRDVIELYLSRKDLDLNICGGLNETGLFTAIFNCTEDTISLLISKPNLNINISNISGFTPLILAIIRKKKNTVKSLLSRDDLKLNKKDKYGITPIMYAVKTDQKKIVQLLISTEKINLNLKNKENKSVFDIAKEKNNQDIIIILENYQKKENTMTQK